MEKNLTDNKNIPFTLNIVGFKQRLNFKNLHYFIPPLIVASILLMVYFMKGIYPFGGLTVVYGDMDQHYIPFSYHIYDVFYSGKSLFWDPFLGTGSNIFGIEALSGMFSPISWLVVFTSRENISNFASYLLLIRMALLSLTSYIFMSKVINNLHIFWRVALSLMYAFSGYALIFYTNMVWLDSAILFPILLLTLKNLYDKNRIRGYIIVLSANLIISYYVSFMLLLFLFFSSGVILHFYVKKSIRKRAMLYLGIGTISSLLLTSFVTIPAFLQSTSSIRFGGFSYLNVIGTDAGSSVTWNKAVFFFFAASSLVVFIKILLNYKLNKGPVRIFGLLVLLTASQVVVEATNMLWYGGSYVCYPLRYGFIPIFILLIGSAYYFSNNFNKKNIEGKINYQINQDIIVVNPNIKMKNFTSENSKNIIKSNAINIIYGIIALLSYLYSIYLGSKFGNAINLTLHGFWGISENLSMLFMFTTILFGISVWIILKIKKNKIKYVLFSIIIFSEILTHCMWYIGVPPRTEHLDDWTFITNETKDILDINNNTISRYKDVDSVLNANYPMVLGAQAVSSYLHMIEASQQNAFKQMGYSINYTRILDTGGTLFSDMIMNVDHYLTSTQYDEDIFEQLGKSKEFFIYRNKFALPVGIKFSPISNKLSSMNEFDLNDNISQIDNQNYMYKTLFNSNENIIEISELTPTLTNIDMVQNGDQLNCKLQKKNTYGSLVYDLSITDKNYIYLCATNISKTININVNNINVNVPTLGNISNTFFPAPFNNGILELGIYNNQTVRIEIIIKQDTDFNMLKIGTLNVEKLEKISSNYSSSNNDINYINIDGNEININIMSDKKGQSFFLPVNYDQAWKCKINGKDISVNKIFGTFIMLDLFEGQNSIELQFIPKGFKEGLLLSGTTILLIILILFISKKKKLYNCIFYLKKNSRLEKVINININIAYITFWSVYFTALLFVYIIPLISFIIRNTIKIIFK